MKILTALIVLLFVGIIATRLAVAAAWTVTDHAKRFEVAGT